MEQRISQLEQALQSVTQQFADYAQQHEGRAEQTVLLAREVIAKASAPPPPTPNLGFTDRAFDVKTARQPPVFKGTSKEWRTWSFRFKRYIAALDEP
eukprot:3555202-Amphidinium_carterae.1